MSTAEPRLQAVSPFESMPDVRLLGYLGLTLLVLSIWTSGVLFVSLVLVVVLFALWLTFRLARRLWPRYARLHYPLAIRYSAALGAGVARRGGDTTLDTDTIVDFLRTHVYVGLSDSAATQLIATTTEKVTTFSDRTSLLTHLSQQLGGEAATVNTYLDQLHARLKTAPLGGYVAEWLFAEIIEREFGPAERTRYLAEVIAGRVAV